MLQWCVCPLDVSVQFLHHLVRVGWPVRLVFPFLLSLHVGRFVLRKRVVALLAELSHDVGSFLNLLQLLHRFLKRSISKI